MGEFAINLKNLNSFNFMEGITSQLNNLSEESNFFPSTNIKSIPADSFQTTNTQNKGNAVHILHLSRAMALNYLVNYPDGGAHYYAINTVPIVIGDIGSKYAMSVNSYDRETNRNIPIRIEVSSRHNFSEAELAGILVHEAHHASRLEYATSSIDEEKNAWAVQCRFYQDYARRNGGISFQNNSIRAVYEAFAAGDWGRFDSLIREYYPDANESGQGSGM